MDNHLNGVAERILSKGGKVVVAAAVSMPVKTGAAGTFH